MLTWLFDRYYQTLKLHNNHDFQCTRKCESRLQTILVHFLIFKFQCIFSEGKCTHSICMLYACPEIIYVYLKKIKHGYGIGMMIVPGSMYMFNIFYIHHADNGIVIVKLGFHWFIGFWWY